MTGDGRRGTLFAIQRFSVHDGPGIRTTAFLKGCPLACRWCQNPEGLESAIGLWHFANLCVGCGRCLTVCQTGALAASDPDGIAIDEGRCVRCGACIAACNHDALAFDGFTMEAGELAEELLADRVFFETSGGGVTFSGGEPFAQAGFMRETAKQLKDRGVHVAVETSLRADWEHIEASLEAVDLFIVDVKAVDPDLHRLATGVDNAPILDAFRRLAGRLRDGKRLLVRTPLIPGYTATEKNLRETGEFVRDVAPWAGRELVNFNPLAAAKYRRLRRPAEVFAPGAREFSADEMRRFAEWAGLEK